MKRVRRTVLAVLCLGAGAALAGCGVDGEPKPPAGSAPSGVTISGDARVGVAGNL